MIFEVPVVVADEVVVQSFLNVAASPGKITELNEFLQNVLFIVFMLKTFQTERKSLTEIMEWMLFVLILAKMLTSDWLYHHKSPACFTFVSIARNVAGNIQS